jgi:hypothetical protein
MSTLDGVYVSWGANDARPDRKVSRACNRCYGSQVSVREIEVELVSQFGTAHRKGEEGETGCGIPAPGPEWWKESDGDVSD